MKVIVDNYTIPEINVQVTCVHCKSELLITQVSDLLVGLHKEYDQRDNGSWEEKHLEVQCPLCEMKFRVPKDKFPGAVIRKLYTGV